MKNKLRPDAMIKKLVAIHRDNSGIDNQEISKSK